MNLYRELILDHYKHPRNVGALDRANASASESNASCGDEITIQLQVTRHKLADSYVGGQARNNKQVLIIQQVRWQGTGCAISTAAASLLSEKIQGMSVADTQKLTDRDVTTLLGGEISFARMKCAMLPLEALHAALNTL